MSLNESNLGRSLNDVLAKTVRREPPRGYLDVELGVIDVIFGKAMTNLEDKIRINNVEK